MEWEPVIGLEIHVQLATASKIFSGASTAYGAPPNTQACAVDLGLPGVLPVLNRRAVEMAVMFGLAVNAHIAPRSVFARKNYFYPDLPKGYQISQYELPIVGEGRLSIEFADAHGHIVQKTIGITRAHLEEDAGKSVHEGFSDLSGIDLNRAGTPLLEVVSEPEMGSAAEAVGYMKTLHRLVRYLGICDGNMQEGSFRCDANVSVRPLGTSTLGTRAELKNLNSFRFVERAINHEIERQIDLLESGGRVIQETRLYDPDRDETRPMRGKEEANDYRYFPDPDLLPVDIDNNLQERLRGQLPELPNARKQRFMHDYGLNDYTAESLIAEREVADYFQQLVNNMGGEAQLCANWVMGELTGALNKSDLTIDQCPISVDSLADLLRRLLDKTLSGKMAKTVFDALWQGQTDVDAVIAEKGLQQISDEGELVRMVEQVLADNPGQVEQFKKGKTKLMGFFVGQVMKASRGQANPARVSELFSERLTT